jgi:hypothetical protein
LQSPSVALAISNIPAFVPQQQCLLLPPCSVSGLESVWPKLVSLEVNGWALDAGSITAIQQLEGLTSIKLQGGREPGTALHARLALPLLDKPGLKQLMLLEVGKIVGPQRTLSKCANNRMHQGALHAAFV